MINVAWAISCCDMLWIRNKKSKIIVQLTTGIKKVGMLNMLCEIHIQNWFSFFISFNGKWHLFAIVPFWCLHGFLCNANALLRIIKKWAKNDLVKIYVNTKIQCGM